MISIDEAINKLIGIEGEYTNNPNDSGGETIWGITLATARKYAYTGSMRSMPRTEAARIYKEKFIIEPKIDTIWAIDDRIAYEVFDTGVNCGPQKACMYLQTALNALNRGGKDYADVGLDGDIGPATRQALKTYLTLRKLDGEIVLLKILNVLQGAFYLNLAVARTKDEDFIFGWFRTRIDIVLR